ncbi:MAG: hypothetical protein LBI33_00465 [Propionibacteriaceae bacterium]|jgi:hypothetical protein|nr:hypothetical protein [Propionibacteriaceae bacterium]
MPTLERRVQVLFEPEEYALLAAQAEREHRSVGSLVRQSVRQTLSPPAATRQAVLERLLARADADPRPVGDWAGVKDGFERPSLRVVG